MEEVSQEVIDSWFDRSVDSIDDFIKELNQQPQDYNSIVNAVAAVAYQAAKAMDRSEQGGITGFQAGGVMWTFIRKWMHEEGPMKLVLYQNMLYPQYGHEFNDATISKETFEWLQKEAQKLIEKHKNREHTSIAVYEHWQSIVNGQVPFGYSIEVEDDDKRS